MKIFKKEADFETVYDGLYTISQVSDRIGEFSYKIERSKIRLFVLDDEGFDGDPLGSVGYKDITKCTKFEDLDFFQSADIILCDIDGVGGDLDPGKQGLAVAENLKQKYPEKIVVIYTSKNIRSYGGEPDIVDTVIRKNITMSDLAFELDDLYKKTKNVILVWKKIRNDMLDNGIATKTVAFIEHYYCKSLLDKTNLFSDNEVKSFVAKEKIEKFIAVLADIITLFSVA